MFKQSLFVVLVKLLTSHAYKNVYGDELQSCSSSGMALTGYTRNGQCIDRNDDQGSHHICIDLSTNTGGNFCDVTGQPDWCSSYMPCHNDQSSSCQIQNWCVCQWAFASYVQNAGGCDKIQDIVCESINLEAVKAYQTMKNKSAKYSSALDCLAERCGLDLSNAVLYGVSTPLGKLLPYIFIVVGVLAGISWWCLSQGRSAHKTLTPFGEPMLRTHSHSIT